MKPHKLDIDDLRGLEFDHIIGFSARGQKRLVCVVRPISNDIYFTVLHERAKFEYRYLKNAIQKYNEL